ncbi:MAG: hypothetical protein R3D55_24885 [Chloroflexota bacterium]
MMTTIIEAQKNMRQAYFSGGPGVLASGLVWLVAGIVAVSSSILAGVVALLIGGMFIHPAGILLAKLLKRPGKHQQNNPLGQLAGESVFVLFIGIFIAFAMFQSRPELFFPVMLLVIGGRYLLFATMYGMRLYWGIGGVLAGAGMFITVSGAPFAWGAFVGGTIELISASIIFYKER